MVLDALGLGLGAVRDRVPGLVLTLATMLMGLLPWAAVAQPVAEAPLVLEAIAPGVYLHRGAIAEWGDGRQDDVANLGVVVGERCVAVIDSGGSPAVGRRLRAAVGRLTPLPVCQVIATHAHPDHVFGHAAFRGSGPGGADPQFLGHARHAAALAARGRRFLTTLQRDIDPASDAGAVIAPTEGVPAGTVREIDLGGRVLQLTAWPTAHTDSDLSVFDPASRSLFLGDLWFVGHLPVLDGSLRGWLRAMDALAATDAVTMVPGHGGPSREGPAALQVQRAYLGELLATTRAALKARRTIREAVEGSTIDLARWQLGELYHRRNLTAAYAELEWED